MSSIYKQAIRIGDNITDVMRLPCVLACFKQSREKCNFLYEIETSDFPHYAARGEWLCEDRNWEWHIVKDINNI